MFSLQQDGPVKPAFGDKEARSGAPSVRLIGSGQQRGNRKCEKDGNFNFLGQGDDILSGDENRNQLRSRAQCAQGRDANFGSGALSPLSRLPCWSPLEPLPEIEIGEEGCGRVPPEGAEGKMDEEETARGREDENEKKVLFEAEEEEDEEDEEEEEEEEEEDGEVREEWGDSDSEFEFSYRSSGSSSSLSSDSGEGAGAFGCIWDRLCAGGGRVEERLGGGMVNRAGDGEGEAERGCKGLGEACPQAEGSSESDTDLFSDLPELQEAVWSLRDREKFKAREMEKHQVQLTMYRRLALIRWVRTLQARVQDQQNRLQSSFDVILTHRKELLRLGAATASQS